VSSDDQPKRRPTPPAFLVSTLPSPPGNGGDIPEVELTDEARDALLRKLAVRVERIDRELGVVVMAVEGHGTTHRGMRHDIRQLCSDVRSLNGKMDVMKDLLTDVLTRLPQPAE